MKGEGDLLFVFEYGVYPELIRALQGTAYEVKVEHLMRKAISFLKKRAPSIVVAEFYHDPAFRDRVSNLESMLAHLQRKLPQSRVVIIYDPADEPFLQQLMARFPVDQTIPHPVDPEMLVEAVTRRN